MACKPPKFKKRDRDMLSRVASRIKAVCALIDSLPDLEARAFRNAQLAPVALEWDALAADAGMISIPGKACRCSGVVPLAVAAGAGAVAAAIAATIHAASFEARATRALRRMVTQIEKREVLSVESYQRIREFEGACGFGGIVCETGKALRGFPKFALGVAAALVVAEGARRLFVRAREAVS